MELDRHFIERTDFSAARRGYDPDEVDRHLREIADAVTELKRSQKRSPSSLAASAAEQVRGIVEAAERSASEIQEQAEAEARRITEDASNAARETRQKADSDAMERVSEAEAASQRMLERAGSVEGEIDRLLGDMRAAAGSLVENIRNGSQSLERELGAFREEFESVRGARLEDAGAAAATPTPEPVTDDAGPPDVEPDVVAEVEAETGGAPPDLVAVEQESEPVDDVAEETLARDAVTDDGEPEVEEEEPAPEAPAVAEESPAESSSAGGRSIRGAEGARLIALNMALNGTPRDETARYLSQNFELEDQDALLDEVYARVGG